MAERAIYLKVGVKDQEAFRRALQEMGKDGEAMLRRIEDAGKPASRSLAVVSATASELKTSLTSAGSSLGPLSAGLGALGGAAGAVGLGVAGLAVGFVALTKRSLETADALGDAADSIGLSIKAYQELSGATRLVGVSTEQFQVGIKTLQDRLATAARDGGEAAKPFRALGIAFQTATGEARGAGEAIFDIADAFKATVNPADLVNRSIDFFGGKAGPRFIAALKDGSKGLRDFAGEAAALGLILDDKLVRDAGKANDQLDLMREIVGAKLTLAFLNVAPHVDRFASFMLEISKAQGAIGVIKGIADALGSLPLLPGGLGTAKVAGMGISALIGDVDQLTVLGKEIDSIRAKLLQADKDLKERGEGMAGASLRALVDQLGAELRALEQTKSAILKGAQSFSAPPGPGDVKPAGALTKSELAKQAEESAKALDKLRGEFKSLQGAVNPVVKITQEYEARLATLSEAVLKLNVGSEEELRIRAEIERWRAEALAAADKETLALVKAAEEQEKRNVGVEKYIVGLEEHAVAAARSATEEKVLLAINEAQAKLVDELGRKTRDLVGEEKARIRAAVEGKSAFDEAQKAAEKFAQDQQRLVERSADRLVDVGADLIFDALEARGEDYWQKFTAWGKRAFAQLLGEQLLRPIAINLISSALGMPQAPGQTATGFNPLSSLQMAGQAKGGLDFLSNIPSMLKSIFSPDNFIANMFPSIFGAGATGAAIASVAPASALLGPGGAAMFAPSLTAAAGPLAAMAPFLPLLALTLPLILPGVANRACRVVPVASPTGGVERRRA